MLNFADKESPYGEFRRVRDVILDAAFHVGCNGNLKGIVALAKGQKISEVIARLAGITC